ncbi:hypothetical protein TMatcc_003205 [Talaromyces marneffei ATCC 18224]|uniref:HhH-GPD domain-containing protein n=1 Tax=Talaromyces marneffei (strain ATCC 18224 / CBS 334.59 / QM 7333) TaxID=441960 RepID=B6Q5L4_TALMQ|nr:uncharacterized protein EYB26_001731 [Talaromyces marneffei]EEA28467.1 conserved hypothetical protein [Talaromyces marneffei ATCC 18224]KAE8555906.1 hypothetical protein EYB25_000604 [Talaromyces marneffei]QGA14078.1 hypothetical protein EYB26_001731 [Talaromyces marneffei]
MVQTRSGQASMASESKPQTTHFKASKKATTNNVKTKDAKEPVNANKKELPAETVPEKRKRDGESKNDNAQDEDQEPLSKAEQASPSKAVKEDEEETAKSKEKVIEEEEKRENVPSTIAHKIHKTIEEYGTLPLEGLGVDKPLEPTPEVLLAIVIDSMLRSTRISHLLAQKTSISVFKAGYHDINVLSKMSWDDRVQVLSEGGYNRYREMTATKLGNLAQLVNEKYDGDLNNLLKKAGDNPAQIRHLVREIKGFGDIATDLFCDDAQAVWHVLAPTIDHRSLDTAKDVGIGTDIKAIYAELGRDPVQMSKLARGLSAVRLSKHQVDIEHEE